MGDTFRFLLMLVGVSVVLASVVAGAFTLQTATHCQFAGVQDSPHGAIVVYYAELSPAQQDVFRELLNDRPREVSGTNCPPGDRARRPLIRYQGRYYRIHTWGTIVWSQPPTVAAIGGCLAGAVIIYTALKRTLAWPA